MKLVMRKKFLNEKAFTIIEVIASLVLVAIVGALVIVSTLRIIEGFTIAKMNAATSQKGHIALSRLTKEFTNIISVDTVNTNETSISFASPHYIDGTIQRDEDGTILTDRGVWKHLNTILIGNSGNINSGTGDILVDNVSGFTLTYYDADGSEDTEWSSTSKTIGITLSLVGAKDKSSTFTTRVVPRNM